MAQNVLDDRQVGRGIEVDAERLQFPEMTRRVVGQTDGGIIKTFFICRRCSELVSKSVCSWQVFASGMCLPLASVCLWHVFAPAKCLPLASVCRWQVFAPGTCLPLARVCPWQVFSPVKPFQSNCTSEFEVRSPHG
jgi:hypothetical protein